MPASSLPLDDAVELARTGDVWLFRGRSLADRAIRAATNSPVNHVGMAVVLEDLPPMLWHAELGRSLPDVWTGRYQRGVQLHDLRDAVVLWSVRYGQQAWLRQLQPEVGPEAEDALLRVIARMDGAPFPSSVGLVGRWLTGRARREASLETAYCAELVAVTYQEMGLLAERRPANWYDPGRFWSGDRLRLDGGAVLGAEIAVTIPPGTADPGPPRSAKARRRSVPRWLVPHRPALPRLRAGWAALPRPTVPHLPAPGLPHLPTLPPAHGRGAAGWRLGRRLGRRRQT